MFWEFSPFSNFEKFTLDLSEKELLVRNMWKVYTRPTSESDFLSSIFLPIFQDFFLSKVADFWVGQQDILSFLALSALLYRLTGIFDIFQKNMNFGNFSKSLSMQIFELVSKAFSVKFPAL
jgi:hypothetical protein